jgi:arginyl-tRNA synthetase
MSTPNTFPDLLTRRVQAALPALTAPLPEGFDAAVTAAADTRYGDYQTNAAMILAKQAKANPRALAQELAEKIDVAGISAAPSVAGPGFINFTLTNEALAARLAELLADPRLGVAPSPSPRTIVVDFSAPNVAKQMHVGHIRSTIIGDSLARIARFLGHRVITDNHIGDWGTQFGMVLHGWKHFRDDAALEADPIAELLRLYKKVNSLQESDPALREQCKAELVKLQRGDAENLAIWERCVALSIAGLDAIYEKLDIRFDHHLGESFYNDRLAGLVEDLKAKGIARESEGAQCIFFDGVPGLEDKPALVQKSDGGFLYATTDLATIEHRVTQWSADEIWYVVGAPQSLHFQQIFEAARRWGVQAKLVHIAFGSILGSDGKMFKTRKGESVGLKEVLEEGAERARAAVEEKNADLPEEEKSAVADAVGVGAIKYAELSQNRLTDYKFSWEKMLSLHGNTAPYLQYSYVRTRSIFRKLEGAELHFGGPFILTESAERSLALKLAQFAEIVPEVLADFRPNLLAGYLYEAATCFHSFYEACPVLKAEGAARDARIGLCELTSRVLKTGLELLGIRVTERM